ncbi:MAG: sugar phosphate isomerase/epimerase [Clostridia bacterium]|nr:sugar phosphate isomerase/epimerase [Clostridia bacterium]
MMKTCMEFSPYLHTYGFEEGLKRMKSHGYDALDYGGFVHTENKIFHVSEEEFAATLKRERAVIEANGLLVNQTHGAWRWPAQDFSAYDRAERYAAMETGIRGTALLGAPYFVIHCIMPFGENNPAHKDRLWEMNVEYFTRLCRVAEDVGVTICFENLPFTSLPLSRWNETLEFVRLMNTPTMKMCLDTGHAAVYGDSPADAVRAIGKDLLATLHVHDNDGHGDRHWLPGEGVIDWVDFTKALHEIGFEGCVSLETSVKHEGDPELWDAKERELFAKVKSMADGTYGQ